MVNDTVSYGSPPIAFIAGQNFTITFRVPEEYLSNNAWVVFMKNETHPREFKGITAEVRGTIKATNTKSGGFMGPWKSIP